MDAGRSRRFQPLPFLLELQDILRRLVMEGNACVLEQHTGSLDAERLRETSSDCAEIPHVAMRLLELQKRSICTRSNCQIGKVDRTRLAGLPNSSAFQTSPQNPKP
jgi:hypothetical protein